MLQEFYTLLNFNFFMVFIIHKTFILLKDYLKYLKGRIFKCFSKTFISKKIKIK